MQAAIETGRCSYWMRPGKRFKVDNTRNVNKSYGKVFYWRQRLFSFKIYTTVLHSHSSVYYIAYLDGPMAFLPDELITGLDEWLVSSIRFASKQPGSIFRKGSSHKRRNLHTMRNSCASYKSVDARFPGIRRKSKKKWKSKSHSKPINVHERMIQEIWVCIRNNDQVRSTGHKFFNMRSS